MLISEASVSTNGEVPPADAAFLLLTTNNDKPTKYPHVLGGVIACGYCRDLGLSFADSAMKQAVKQRNDKRKGAGERDYIPAIKCWGGYRSPQGQRHPLFLLGENRVARQWEEYVSRIVRLPIDGKHLALWFAATSGGAEIAQVDQMEAAVIEQRRRIIWRLGNERDEAVTRQVRAALRDLDVEDQKLQALKQKAASRPAVADETTLRSILKRYASVYADASPKDKNGLNRLLVGALGSMPSVKRLGELGKPPGITKGADVIFRWPEVDAILEAACPS